MAWRGLGTPIWCLTIVVSSEDTLRWYSTGFALSLPISRKLRDNRHLPGSIRVCLEGKDSVQVLMIRLARIGARKQPYYRVVVIEKERARNGRSVEVVGLYNPRTSPATLNLKRDRSDFWVSKGAQLSETVSRLISKSAPAPTAGTAA